MRASREISARVMLPTTTASLAGTPSKSRARFRETSALWDALTRRRASFGEGEDYANGKGSKRRSKRGLALAKQSGIDYALGACLLITLYVTRALLVRQDDFVNARPSAVRSGRARRIGPMDDLALANTIRFDAANGTRPLSLYGRAALLNALPGFPETPPLVLSATQPKAYLLRNFLSAEECDHLMKLAKRELAPSTVVGEAGDSVPSDIRTSAGMFLRKGQDKIVKAIEERIARVSGTPVDNGEGMQILRYDVGQKYDPHFDYFHDKVNPAPKRGGQRLATMLIYLVDTDKGGETTFPNAKLPQSFEADEPENPFASHIEHTDCAKKGIPVKSVRGDAILFFSMTQDGVLDRGSLHGACPVIEGQKWTAVKWIRVGKFDGNYQEEIPMPKLSRRTDEEPCVDDWDECAKWASQGWCELNPEFMTTADSARDSQSAACAKSCGLCNRRS
jgi:prolyl 4-hydroxylase